MTAELDASAVRAENDESFGDRELDGAFASVIAKTCRYWAAVSDECDDGLPQQPVAYRDPVGCSD
jgi:hypothetical protein